jgi:hypothetical protein
LLELVVVIAVSVVLDLAKRRSYVRRGDIYAGGVRMLWLKVYALYTFTFTSSASALSACVCLTNRFGPLLESFLLRAAGDCVTGIVSVHR